MEFSKFEVLAEKYVSVMRDLRASRAEVNKHTEIVRNLEKNIQVLSGDLSMNLGGYGYTANAIEGAIRMMKTAREHCQSSLNDARTKVTKELEIVSRLENEVNVIILKVTE